MGRKRKEHTILVTHTYVPEPAAVEQGLQLWASYLAQYLIGRMAEGEGDREDHPEGSRP